MVEMLKGNSFLFFLSLTEQAGRIQVEIPNRGKSHPCKKNHKAIIKIKIRKSLISIYPLTG